ncbi:MAG: hypothetical protein AAGI11_00385 [Pseudomonadota bacterium]
MVNWLLAFLAAVIAAFAAGSIMATQFILGNVSAMGMDVTAGVRLHATLHDLAGLAPTYMPLIAVAFLIGLSSGSGLSRLLPAQRLWLCILAGAVSLIAIHMIMKAVLGLSGIAATRTLAGLLSQGLAGALGGYVFAMIRRRPSGAAHDG